MDFQSLSDTCNINLDLQFCTAYTCVVFLSDCKDICATFQKLIEDIAVKQRFDVSFTSPTFDKETRTATVQIKGSKRNLPLTVRNEICVISQFFVLRPFYSSWTPNICM